MRRDTAPAKPKHQQALTGDRLEHRRPPGHQYAAGSNHTRSKPSSHAIYDRIARRRPSPHLDLPRPPRTSPRPRHRPGQPRTAPSSLPLYGIPFAAQRQHRRHQPPHPPAGCPAYAYTPTHSRLPSSTRLEAAGAILIGKDQHGSVRHRPRRHPHPVRHSHSSVFSQRPHRRRLQLRLRGRHRQRHSSPSPSAPTPPAPVASPAMPSNNLIGLKPTRGAHQRPRASSPPAALSTASPSSPRPPPTPPLVLSASPKAPDTRRPLLAHPNHRRRAHLPGPVHLNLPLRRPLTPPSASSSATPLHPSPLQRKLSTSPTEHLGGTNPFRDRPLTPSSPPRSLLYQGPLDRGALRRHRPPL